MALRQADYQSAKRQVANLRYKSTDHREGERSYILRLDDRFHLQSATIESVGFMAAGAAAVFGL